MRIDAGDIQSLSAQNANGIYSADYSAIVPTLHGELDAGTL